MVQALAGDQSDIRRSPHILLAQTHRGIPECEADCRWISHRCNGRKSDHYEACTLLDLARTTNAGATSSLSLGSNNVSRRLTPSVPPISEAGSPRDDPDPLSTDNRSSQVVAASGVSRGHAGAISDRAPIEPFPSSAPVIQRTDMASSSSTAQRLPSAAPGSVAVSDATQREAAVEDIDEASTPSDAACDATPRQYPSGASKVSGRVNVGENGGEVEWANGLGEDINRAAPGHDVHDIDLTAAAKSSPPRKCVSGPSDADAASIGMATRILDSITSAAVVDLGQSLLTPTLSRPSGVDKLSMPTKPDAAETAASHNAAVPCASSAHVLDCAQLFLAVDEPGAPAGPSFEMEDLRKTGVGSSGGDEHAEGGDDREGGGDDGRGNAVVEDGAGRQSQP